MQPLKIYSVVARLPEKLNPLWDLAYNFWFTWNHEIGEFFAQIDQELWRRSYANPVWFLNNLSLSTLKSLAEDQFFLERLKELKTAQENYLAKTKSYIDFLNSGIEGDHPMVAYFSMEFGLALCMPVYSGGLGVLAGDHLKSASDLNIPLVGVGLCYRQGYFRQYLTADGWQQERYPDYDFELLPVRQVRDEDGKPITVTMQLQDRPLHFRIWLAQVGRIKLYLLDTNFAENPEDFRQITYRLYGGDLEMRLWQEILLGIGGIKALDALGLSPRVIHMNEGHSAFAGLERIRILMSEYDLSFESAMEVVASTSVFTTHTPVPAGIDRFPPDMMQRYFGKYASDMGLAMKVFMALGRENPHDASEPFCMTVLAMRLSRFINGVSKLHGEVSRNIFSGVWPQYPVEDIPIGAITNGVHVPSWVAPDIAILYNRYLGSNWKEDPDCQRVWKQTTAIPDAELWRTHERLRERLIGYVRYRLREQMKSRGARLRDLQKAEEVLDPRALTIGFARRFATYKRANLLLQDKQRLISILTNKDRPVQIIMAGKAHPKDNEGKKLIQQIVQLCGESACRLSIVFLEDYDMEVAAYMVQGCDIWINTPRRPLEACGTSGMKAMCNGVLNISVPDGWWDEAYALEPGVGWAIGQGEQYEDYGYQDFVESQIMYNLLENDVAPLFYDRGHDGLPRNWIKKMKLGLSILGPLYNSNRMLEDYAYKAYVPGYYNYSSLTENKFAPAKALAAWRMEIMTKWSEIKIRKVRAATQTSIYVDEPLAVTAEIYLNGLTPDDVRVEIYSGPVDQNERFSKRSTTKMTSDGPAKDGWHKFKGDIKPTESGRFGFTVRVLPSHPLLTDPHSLGLIHWAPGD